MNYTRIEICVGAVVLAGVALLVGAVVTVLDVQAMFQPTAHLLVRYQNVKGLKPGAVVQLNGVPIGSVTGVDLFTMDLGKLTGDEHRRLRDLGWLVPPRADPNQPWQMTAVKVTLGVPARYTDRVRPDARIVVIKSLTGQIVIDIEHSGVSPQDWTGEPFWGPETTAFTDAARELGIGQEQKDDLRAIMRSARGLAKNMEAFSATMNEIDAEDVTKAKGWLRETLERIAAAAQDVRKLVKADTGDLPLAVKELRGMVQGARMPVKATLADLKAAAEKTNVFMDEANKLVAAVNAEITREAVRRVVHNVTDASESLKQVLASAKKTIAAADDSVAVVHDLVKENQPTLRRVMENVEDASAYLRLTLKDLNRQPWKLIKGPGAEDDTEGADLYRALREFNEGAGDLELVTRQLNALLRGKTPPSADRKEMIQRLQKRLEHVSKNFEKLEKELWEKLGRQK